MWGAGIALLAVGLDVGVINLYGLSQSRPGETTCHCDGYLGSAGVAVSGHARQDVVYAVSPR
jgi:hypothetical protein